MYGKFKSFNNDLSKISKKIKQDNLGNKSIAVRTDEEGIQKLKETIDKQNEVLEEGATLSGKLEVATLPSAGLTKRRDKWYNIKNQHCQKMKEVKESRDNNLKFLVDC